MKKLKSISVMLIVITAIVFISCVRIESDDPEPEGNLEIEQPIVDPIVILPLPEPPKPEQH